MGSPNEPSKPIRPPAEPESNAELQLEDTARTMLSISGDVIAQYIDRLLASDALDTQVAMVFATKLINLKREVQGHIDNLIPAAPMGDAE